MRLRFGTFNIRNAHGPDLFHAWPVRRRATAAAIAGLGADLLGLQEVYESQRRYLGRKLPQLRWCGEGRAGGRAGEQCPVAVAGPDLTVLREQTRWFGTEPEVPGTRLPGASFPRIATLVRCRHEPSGTVFDVANTHLDERLAGNRAASVRQLLDWLDLAVPTVVLGDFNAVPGEAEVLAPLAEAGLRMAPVPGGTSHAFTGRADGPQIDHVFTSPHWTVEEAVVVRDRPFGRLPSDHWPVRVTARLGDGAGP